MCADVNAESYTPWTGRMVWDGRTLQQIDNWSFELSDTEVNQLYSAVRASIASTKPLAEQSHHDFDLDKLSKRLSFVHEEILNGLGFTLIRGLSKTHWTDAELIRAYWIIGSLFGAPVPQNARADLLGHVTDLRNTDASTVRIYQTNAAQPFHSDSCDIVGLMCLRPAKRGGGSAIASSAMIHNHLLEHNPNTEKYLKAKRLSTRFIYSIRLMVIWFVVAWIPIFALHLGLSVSMT